MHVSQRKNIKKFSTYLPPTLCEFLLWEWCSEAWRMKPPSTGEALSSWLLVDSVRPYSRRNQLTNRHKSQSVTDIYSTSLNEHITLTATHWASMKFWNHFYWSGFSLTSSSVSWWLPWYLLLCLGYFELISSFLTLHSSSDTVYFKSTQESINQPIYKSI
jgi:hypothetical protein